MKTNNNTNLFNKQITDQGDNMKIRGTPTPDTENMIDNLHTYIV